MSSDRSDDLFDPQPHRPVVPDHPAKFSKAIIAVLARILDDEVVAHGPLRVLDPMAGVGGIHALVSPKIETVGVELEVEWSTAHPRTLQGDATALPFGDDLFDAVVTSPCYGNRMADHHNARDIDPKTGKLSKRMTYRHKLGRDLSPNSGAALQWGRAYRDLHKRILAEMVRVTKPGGLIVVNVSDHIRGGERMHVADWWRQSMVDAGLRGEFIVDVPTQRMGFGANRSVRVECEHIIVTRKPERPDAQP